MIKKRVPIQFSADDIKLEDTSSMKLWKDNPRVNDEAVAPLAKIIATHGQRTPVLAWRKNRTVYKGNTTLKAMRLLKMKQIAVLWADFPSEAAAKAYGIDDNKSSEFADWDEEILVGLMQSKEISPMVRGFSENERRGLFMLPNLDMIGKVNAANIGLKDKIIVMVLDAAKKDEVRDMLKTWLVTAGIKGVEVK